MGVPVHMSERAGIWTNRQPCRAIGIVVCEGHYGPLLERRIINARLSLASARGLPFPRRLA